MIIEIIVIILSFLFPAYLVYKYSGDEKAEQQIEVQENEEQRNNGNAEQRNNGNAEQQIEVQENEEQRNNGNAEQRNNGNAEQQIAVQGNAEQQIEVPENGGGRNRRNRVIDNDHLNINNENNGNAEQQIEVQENEGGRNRRNRVIDNDHLNINNEPLNNSINNNNININPNKNNLSLNDRVRMKLKKKLEKKLNKGKEAVEQWIKRNKEEFNNGKDIQKIVDQIYNSEENTRTFKEKCRENKTYLLTNKEIKHILYEKLNKYLSVAQYNQLQEIEKKELEKIQEEKEDKEEEKRKEEEPINNMSHGEIIALQNREFEELQKKHAEKEKKEEEERKKKLEEEKKIKEYENEAKMAKMLLGEEPDDNNPDVCFIKFRLPDGEKILERKFLKTDKISILYDYVKSNGREIFMEPDATDFDILCSGFPPQNLENKKNSTLEKEGLYPNSILQIREK